MPTAKARQLKRVNASSIYRCNYLTSCRKTAFCRAKLPELWKGNHVIEWLRPLMKRHRRQRVTTDGPSVRSFHRRRVCTLINVSSLADELVFCASSKIFSTLP
ncbi:predicted protein [Sclerotinia sclerotiorum 1980 UF-70]|uniref:Uncharacterized protein n=1 Tax=Sclerotinia sclerotiorum (strain ATCC 18683 / 1980 / Ss-1) TaxID=665079 RepID=A7F274_SCLS1|nr:predicted protein [Sclerotinia sclerotiorum 1980 UF-70]EDN95816.1 predicted protein [Sclerotinia sclerotiorum 1980 UF-70]